MIVYFHRNPKTYQIFYVGIGSLIRRAKAIGMKDRSEYWHRYVNKHGLPIIQIVHTDISKEQAKKWEIYYIQLLGKTNNKGQLVNIANGGDLAENLAEWVRDNPEKNPSFKPEHAIRMRKNNPMHNPIYVEKVRIYNTGKKHSELTKLKQRLLKIGKPSNQPKGYKHSAEVISRLKHINKEIANRPEVREKLRNQKLGVRKESNFVSVKMIDLKTNEVLKIFPSIADALMSLNKSTRDGNISSVCRRKRNFAFGYKWQYINLPK